ncbi:MAG: single-stranded-DNA-specific exonuclease RecJ, partial [Bacillota bacterium]
MRRNQAWSVINPAINHEQKVQTLMSELEISQVLADLLVKRNLADPETARRFLHPEINYLSHPLSIPGMAEAVGRIREAVDRQEKVVIYGDYDADGICSVTVLKEFLENLLPEVGYYIPNRFQEGYGLNSDAIRSIHAQGCQLLITVDCGIVSLDEVKLAYQLGMDVVVTDHHQPGSLLPTAAAVVNPKLDPGCSELAGVGVAFYLVRALTQVYPGIDPLEWLELVALGTVADIVPLTGDNRILVKEGIKRLRVTRRPGLKALIDASGLKGGELRYWHLGFILAPRLNAAGRMEDAGSAVELLLTRSDVEARMLAEKLRVLNTTRQGIELNILKEAQAEASLRAAQGDKVLVLAQEGWHQGVLGIVASRLVENLGRPVLLISWEGEQGKGSGRTVPGFDLFAALDRCRDHLERFGGHQQAAGVVVHRSQIDTLRMALNEVAASLWDEHSGSQIVIDGELEIQEITTELVRELAMLEPYGLGNASPVFVLRSAVILNPQAVGKNKEHLKFRVQVQGHTGEPVEAIGFGLADFLEQPLDTQLFDVICELEINSFRGRDRVQMRVYDMKTSDCFDNPGEFTYLIPEHDRSLFERLEGCIKNGLRRGKPILVVYPTLRCLEKHLTGLQRLFPERILAPIHGCLPETVRRRNLQNLGSCRNQVFLTTDAFFRYGVKKRDIGQGMIRIALWPTENLLNEDLADWQVFKRETPEPMLVTASEFTVPEKIGSGRRIIYTNRRNTLRAMSQAGDLEEAGLTDIMQRIKIRRQFLDQQPANIFWDGTFGGGLPPVVADQVILGNCPFGWYEVENLLAQTTGGIPEIIVRFSRDDVNQNRDYLERLYPDREYLCLLYERLRARRGNISLPKI